MFSITQPLLWLHTAAGAGWDSSACKYLRGNIENKANIQAVRGSVQCYVMLLTSFMGQLEDSYLLNMLVGQQKERLMKAFVKIHLEAVQL